MIVNTPCSYSVAKATYGSCVFWTLHSDGCWCYMIHVTHDDDMRLLYCCQEIWSNIFCLEGWSDSWCAKFSSLHIFISEKCLGTRPGSVELLNCLNRALPGRIRVDYSRLCVWVEAALLSPTREYEVVIQRQENSLSSLSSLRPILSLFLSRSFLALISFF